MKILINATCIETARATGIERFALHILRELCRIDPSVIVVASEPLMGVPDVVIPKELVASRSLLGRSEFFFRAVWDQTIFRSTVARHNPDLIFFPIQDGLFFPPLKQIVTVHDLHYLYFNDSVAGCIQEIPAYRRFFYCVKMPHILRKSAAIIAVSEATKNDLIETFSISPDKVHVVYNGCDFDRFHDSIDSMPVLERLGIAGNRYFLFVGSILRHKNIVRLVQAFACLNTNMSLVIAGSCKDQDYLEEVMNASVGLGTGRVQYLKYVPDDELPSLYSGAKAFVLPSLHEGFGVPIIEAMACGTPVITSNCSAMPEVAGDAAILVDPYSVESIADAMRKIIEDPEYADSLRRAGLERVKTFSWSYSAQKLYDVCKMVSGT